MRVVLVGVGQAGGKLTQALARFDDRRRFDAVADALAVNTATTDLDELDVDTLLVGRDRVQGHGVGGDNERGAAVMDADAGDVLGALDDRVTADVDAVVVVAGLGGGTGSGGAPVLVRKLMRVFDRPVYAFGALPGRNEGSLYQANAGRSLKTLLREANGTLVVDNDAWRRAGESVATGHEAVNEAVAQHFGLVVAAGEGDIGTGTAESVVDASEVTHTFRDGGGGVAALGYASVPAAEKAEKNVTTVMSTARSAVHTGTSLPDATRASAALLIVAGRPEAIPRKGVERARAWLEDETGSMQVRGGDVPVDSDRLAVVVLFVGVEGTSRVESFFERARQVSVETDERETETHSERLRSDELDDLF
jgi:cell division GTPase FtsZ